MSNSNMNKINYKEFLKPILILILLLIFFLLFWIKINFGKISLNILFINLNLLYDEFFQSAFDAKINLNLKSNFINWVIFIPFFITFIWSLIYFYKKIFIKYFFLFSVTIILFTISVLLHYTVYIQSTFDNNQSKIDIFEKNFKKINDLSIKDPQNLILVILESYDNDFIKSLDIDTYNQINNLKFKNFNTYNLNNLYTTESSKISIKAQVEFLCGVYLQLNNKNLKKSNYLENHLCIQDIFRLNNYNTELVMNSPITFHSSHRFFLNHYFESIFDSNYFRKLNLFDMNPYSLFNTINDEDVFLFSKKRLATLNDQNQNYFLTIITLDTHAPGNYYDKNKCKPFISKSTQNTYTENSLFTNGNLSESNTEKINSFKCSNAHIIDFLNFIDELNLDTNILLIGDHGYLNGENQRRLYNKIITKKKLNINDKEKFIAHNFEGKYLDCGTMEGYINSSKEIGKI